MKHEPILLPAILEVLAPAPGRLILDGTLGAGGHTEALLESGASVIGIDQDYTAISQAQRRLDTWLSRGREAAVLRLRVLNFRHLDRLIGVGGKQHFDGVLFDLGISSIQLDTESRGFSFQERGPLDMRMNLSSELTAHSIINSWDQRHLSDLIFDLGEEPRDIANRIAYEIVEERSNQTIDRTDQLAAIAMRAVKRAGKRHPATRLFQALRIAVNDELGALSAALSAASSIVKLGGRLALISFHSLEDRIVKRFFRDAVPFGKSGMQGPKRDGTSNSLFRELLRGPILPPPYEQLSNPRARSAKLRAYERIQ